VRKAHTILVGKLEYEKPFRRHRRGGKHNIKMNPEGIIYKHVVWILVVQEKIQSLFLWKRQ
jgi:hypothetical protein